METIPGSGNWKLTVRREAAGLAILRAVTCDARAVLPESLFGIPVTALGDHALSPTAPAAEGEEVLVSCGPAGEWDNRSLEDLTLPRSLRRVGDYALMNCTGLTTLRLCDGVEAWGGAVLMNCRGLDTLRLTRVGEQGDTLAWFADELPWELDVTVEETDGTMFRLLFPEYREVYEENCPAHHFDYNIYGAGYPYHHSFRNKKLDLRTYDELWNGFLGMEHEEESAVRLAFWRLRYPAELTDRARERYLAHLRAHSGLAAAWLVGERDLPGLAFLLKTARLDREALSAACALARETGNTGALALLLEQRRDAVPRGLDRTFDL